MPAPPKAKHRGVALLWRFAGCALLGAALIGVSLLAGTLDYRTFDFEGLLSWIVDDANDYLNLKIIGIASQLITALAALLITIIAYRHTIRSSRLTALQQFIFQWYQFDRLLVQSREARLAYRKFSKHAKNKSGIEERLIVLYLSQAHQAFLMWKMGVIKRTDLDGEFRLVMINLEDKLDKLENIIETIQHSKDFLDKFKEARKNHEVNKANSID